VVHEYLWRRCDANRRVRVRWGDTVRDLQMDIDTISAHRNKLIAAGKVRVVRREIGNVCTYEVVDPGGDVERGSHLVAPEARVLRWQ
jgi:hypothetical protein